MNIDDLNKEIERKDIVFKYKDDYYSICFFGGKYSVYETEVEESEQIFNSFQEMIEGWIIDKTKFINIISDIELM